MTQRAAELVRPTASAAALVLLLALSSGCSRASPEPPRAERVDSAGVTIVRSTGVDIPLEWSWEPALSLGGQPEGPQSFYMLHEWLVDTNALGRIYVLDPTRAAVLVFDSVGTHLRTLGGKGSGPGELVEPMALAVSTGIVAVADFARRSVVRWDSGGNVIAPIDSVSLLPLTHKPIGLLHDRLLTVREEGGAGASDSMEWRLVDAELRGSVPLAAVSRPRSRPTNIGCAFGLFAPLFTTDIVWDVRDSTTALTSGGAYDLWMTRGDNRMRLRRDLPVEEVTRSMALREAGSGMLAIGPQTMECDTPPAERLERQGFAADLPAIADVEIAPDGSIWVERRAIHGDPRLIDIFDASGVYQGTLPPGSPFPVGFLPDGALLTIEKDELDISRLIVQRRVP